MIEFFYLWWDVDSFYFLCLGSSLEPHYGVLTWTCLCYNHGLMRWTRLCISRWFYIYYWDGFACIRSCSMHMDRVAFVSRAGSPECTLMHYVETHQPCKSAMQTWRYGPEARVKRHTIFLEQIRRWQSKMQRPSSMNQARRAGQMHSRRQLMDVRRRWWITRRRESHGGRRRGSRRLACEGSSGISRRDELIRMACVSRWIDTYRVQICPGAKQSNHI
jgi:hypothetical protein